MHAISRRFRGASMQVLLALALTLVGAAQQEQIRNAVSTGRLDGMRWPDFRDYQAWLQKFYQPADYAPAWIQGSAPSPQALAMIELFRNAWQKGLEPEDYDASRWDSRLKALQGGAQNPGPGRADFDVALTVCAMRYISDLRIGRINPKHFQFGLSVEEKKYDLANFIREKLLPAPDVAALAASVEPPFPTYRRTEQALARYIEFARTDKAEKLPSTAKPVEPGQPYA